MKHPFALFTVAALLCAAPAAFSQAPKDEAQKAGKQMKTGTENAGKATGNAAKKAESETTQGAKKIGNEVKKPFEKSHVPTRTKSP